MLLDRYKFLEKAIEKYENRKPYGGKVFKVDLEKGIVEGLSAFITPDGYKRVSLCCDNKKKQFYIHEIIAVKGGLDVVDKTINHIDGNKENNSISNLEAATYKENKAHAVASGLIAKGERNGNSKLTEEIVLKIRKMDSEGISSPRIAEELGVNYFTVRDIVNRVTWKHLDAGCERKVFE